jgi:hypothetical protein
MGVDDTRIRGQSKVVVGGEVDYLSAVDGRSRRRPLATAPLPKCFGGAGLGQTLR